MITVADILALPAFERIDLVAPIEDAGEHRVYNVGILDCPPSINDYSAYMPGEFILTNLGFCYEDPDLSDASLIAMIERRVAAIAVKRVYSPCFTDAVAQASVRMGVPVYLYSGAYHERVAFESLNLLQRDLDASDKSDAVDTLLSGKPKAQVRQEINKLAGLTGSTMRCIAISAEKDDRCSLYAIQDTLNDFLDSFRQRHEDVQNACAFRYHDALLVFVSYATDKQHEGVFCDLENAIRGVGVNCCGIGDLVPLGEADISIRQATILLNEAHLSGTRRLEWSDLSMGAFSYAAQTNPMFERTAQGFRHRIESYDTKLYRTGPNGTCLCALQRRHHRHRRSPTPTPQHRPISVAAYSSTPRHGRFTRPRAARIPFPHFPQQIVRVNSNRHFSQNNSEYARTIGLASRQLLTNNNLFVKNNK